MLLSQGIYKILPQKTESKAETCVYMDSVNPVIVTRHVFKAMTIIFQKAYQCGPVARNETDVPLGYKPLPLKSMPRFQT